MTSYHLQKLLEDARAEVRELADTTAHDEWPGVLVKIGAKLTTVIDSLGNHNFAQETQSMLVGDGLPVPSAAPAADGAAVVELVRGFTARQRRELFDLLLAGFVEDTKGASVQFVNPPPRA